MIYLKKLLWIVPLDEYLAQTMLGSPEENIVIDFDEFTLGNTQFDGIAQPVYYFNQTFPTKPHRSRKVFPKNKKPEACSGFKCSFFKVHN